MSLPLPLQQHTHIVPRIQNSILNSSLLLQLFEESARQVRKEAIQHADQVNKALQQQLEAGLDKKADASVMGREGQSSRQQLTELWAEAEAAREGLDQVKGGLQQVQGQVNGLQDKVAVTKVNFLTDV